MTKASDNLFPKVILNEAATDGSDFSNPSADYRVLFLGEDGALHLKDSSGTVTDVASGGGVAAGDVTVTDSGTYYTGTDVEAVLAELGPERPGAVSTFSPTWTGSGSNPTLGSGTLTGHYKKIAPGLYWFSIVLTYASDSTAGSGLWGFGNLPFTALTGGPEQVVTAQVRDSGTTRFTCTANLTAGASTVGQIIAADGTGARQVTNNAPITWANGDQVFVQGVVATD